MSKKNTTETFDPFIFKGEKIESPVPKHPAINYIWYWDAEKKMYVDPPSGVKRYRAFRRRLMGGKVIRETKCFDRLEEARKWKSYQDCDEVTLNPIDPVAKPSQPTGGPKFEEVMELRRAMKWRTYAESTKIAYEKLLRYLVFFNGMDIRAITPSVIDEWLKEMTASKVLKNQHSTRENYHHELATLSGVLRYYAEYHDDSEFVFPVKKRHWESAIVKRVRNKRKEPLTPIQFEEWVKHLKAQKEGLLKETLVRTQRSGALRISEAAAIHWDDINWEKRFITIKRAVIWPRRKGEPVFIQDGFKNGDQKEVPLTPDAFHALKELRRQHLCPLVFHRAGKPLEYRAIQSAYDRAFKAANLPFRGTHVMRRTGTSWVLDQSGGDVGLAKQILGNSDWATVSLYGKRSHLALKEFNDKLWKEHEEAELTH